MNIRALVAVALLASECSSENGSSSSMADASTADALPNAPAVDAAEAGGQREAGTGSDANAESDASLRDDADASTDTGVVSDATADVSAAVRDACLALCNSTNFGCTFTRNGATSATGSWVVNTRSATGCAGTASTSDGDEVVQLDLVCDTAQICLRESADIDCYASTFDATTFTWEIPQDNKKNWCTSR